MKKLFKAPGLFLAALIVMTAIFTAPAFAQQAAPPADSWTSPDKVKHLAASAAIASAAVLAGYSERQAFAASLAFGIAKEAYDARSGGTGFSGKDLAADALGAYLGAKVPGLVIRRNFVGWRWQL